jgi:tetratricopeptide (TPR) repeat protein
MMNILTKLKLVVLFIFATTTVFAQSSMERGWESFIKNDLDYARKHFAKASSNPNQAADAYLALSLIDQVDKPDEQAFDHFLKFYAKAKDPNPYLYALWFDDNVTGGMGRLTKAQLSWINEIIESGKLNSTMLAKAYGSLGAHYQKLNKYKKADEYYAKVGTIMKWQLAGHFENISGSGYNKDYGPMTEPSNGVEFENRNGAKVKWFSLPSTYRPGQWIYPSNHVYTSDAIIYAQTFIKSDKEQEVQFRLGVSGSIKVAVNDLVIFEEEEERDNGIDTYIFTAKLKKGFNRVVLQIGQSGEVGSINYHLRITDMKGHLLPNLSTYDTPKAYKKETSYKSKIIPNSAEEFFKKRYENDKDDFLNYILLSRAYLANDKSYQARKVILAAQEKAPDCSFFSNMLMEVFLAEDSETLLSLELEKVKKNDPKNPLSLELLFEEAMEKEDWDEADRILEDYEDVVGYNADVADYRIQLLLKEEKYDEAVRLINSGFAEFPNSYSLFNYKLLVALQVYESNASAIKLVKKFMKKNYSTSLELTMANLYGNLGNTAKMVSILNKLIEKTSYLPAYYDKLGDYYYARQSYHTAIRYYNNVAERAPYKSQVYNDLAQCYKEIDEEDDAIENFEMSLNLNPNNFDARSSYRKFIGKKDVYDYFDEPDLYELFENSPDKDKFPEDNSIFLWNETQRVVYENGGSEEKTYLLIKVFNPSGIDRWKEYYTGTENIEKAEVLKKDGNVVKAEVNGSHVVFTNLEEGDAILLIYKEYHYQWGKLLKHFWDREYYNFAFPYVNQKYCLLVEGQRKFQHMVANSDFKPEVTSPDEDFKMYVWERENVPSIKDENYRPSLDDYTEVLHISSIPDWQFVNDWYYDISKTKAKSDFEVQEVVKELFEGKEGLTDLEKAKLIYKYVVEEIRYSSISFRQSGIVPQKASKVINTKIGDCKDVSTLFIAMCSEVGIKADIVLVNTRDNGETEMSLPGIGFNHAIAKAYIDDKVYFVELTSDLNAFATAGEYLKNAFILEISESKTGAEPRLLQSDTRVRNKYHRECTVRFDDNKMIVKRNIVRYGTYAANTRHHYRDVGDEKRKSNLQDIVSEDYAKSKILEFGFDTTLYLPTDSLNYWYEFEVSNPFNMLGNIQLFELPFAWKQEPEDFLNTENRETPLALWKYTVCDSKSETLAITIPDGKRLYEKPKNHKYTSQWGTYTLTFVQKGKVLYATRTMQFTGKDVISVEDFEAFSDFYSKIIKADETQIGFK